jgi:hypothetical protein
VLVPVLLPVLVSASAYALPHYASGTRTSTWHLAQARGTTEKSRFSRSDF